MNKQQKKIALINDFCGFGRCSITVSLPIISALRVQCCPLPTAIFSNHTAYESFYRTDYTDNMCSYMDEWKKRKLHFDGILTGYLGSSAQIDHVMRFFKLFKAPDTICIVDPVMGDNGKLYHGITQELTQNMRALVPFASVLTPNLTEACVLTDTSFIKEPTRDELNAICEKLVAMGPSQIVITGLDYGEALGNYVYDQNGVHELLLFDKTGACRCGTGDVFASILAADCVNRFPLIQSVEHAATFIQKALIRTTQMNTPLTDGICFEECFDDLIALQPDSFSK